MKDGIIVRVATTSNIMTSLNPHLGKKRNDKKIILTISNKVVERNPETKGKMKKIKDNHAQNIKSNY